LFFWRQRRVEANALVLQNAERESDDHRIAREFAAIGDDPPRGDVRPYCMLLTFCESAIFKPSDNFSTNVPKPSTKMLSP
jgi:hypothetical protein